MRAFAATSNKIFLLHDCGEISSKDWISPSKRTVKISQEKRIIYIMLRQARIAFMVIIIIETGKRNIYHFIIAIKI